MNQIPIPNQTQTQNTNRLREHIGLVTNDTSTTQLCFLISPLKNKASVEKTEYVVLDHPTYGDTCQIIAEITDIRAYEEVVGGSISDKTAGNMVATAKIIGYINQQEQNKPMHQLLTPPNPGSRVYIPLADFLEDTFTRGNSGKPYHTPIYIGNIETTAPTDSENKRPLKFCLNAETITNTHTLITAKDGAGKTHTASVIIEEIAQKTQHPIVILDPYNEYSKRGEHASRPVQSIGLNEEKTAKDPAKLVKNNTITTLNAQNLPPNEKQATFANYLEALWNAKLQKNISPFLLIVENAETLKNQTLETIAYEGTKHGVALILIAKHPTELGGKILTQTNTQLMGRTNDKDDLDYLKNIAGEKATMLPQLKRGQWIISTGYTTRPIQVQVREH
jgi:DNA helicase HerA-like ATPase